ncbi:MAG TPA: hypothetical protein VHS78_07210 [Candidatus Elarobacter sp.]|nr:hypothetical protein [Candidatus Elarobacter sp.]
MNLRQTALAALAVLSLAGTAAAQAGPIGQSATPTPTAAPAASASPAPAGRRGRRGGPAPSPEPSASETPEPPQFSTMDGVWEVQMQPLLTGKTIYSHLAITQKGDQLSGTWVRGDKDKVPFTGTFDGRLFKLTTTDPSGKVTWTLAGYAENFSDMVGLLTTPDPKDKGTPFTASHRKKERLGL